MFKKTGCVKLNWLRNELQKVSEEVLHDHGKLMYYVRAYVLYLIGSMIVPDKTGTLASICFLPLLDDVSVKLIHVIQQLKKTNRSQCPSFVGNNHQPDKVQDISPNIIHKLSMIMQHIIWDFLELIPKPI